MISFELDIFTHTSRIKTTEMDMSKAASIAGFPCLRASPPSTVPRSPAATTPSSFLLPLRHLPATGTQSAMTIRRRLAAAPVTTRLAYLSPRLKLTLLINPPLVVVSQQAQCETQLFNTQSGILTPSCGFGTGYWT